MSPSDHHAREPARVRIPADVDRPDRIVAGLTTRQLALLAAAGVGLWIAYTATANVVPLAVFAACAFPAAVAAVVLALGRRDGVSLDRLAVAAVRQARAPRRRVPAPDGVPDAPGWVDADHGSLPAPLRLPARGIRPDGMIDLGTNGAAVLVACCTLNFALRTTREQEALVAAFGRYLNSLTAPVQVVIRAERVDLAPTIARLRQAAPGLPHPANTPLSWPTWPPGVTCCNARCCSSSANPTPPRPAADTAATAATPPPHARPAAGTKPPARSPPPASPPASWTARRRPPPYPRPPIRAARPDPRGWPRPTP